MPNEMYAAGLSRAQKNAGTISLHADDVETVFVAKDLPKRIFLITGVKILNRLVVIAPEI